MFAECSLQLTAVHSRVIELEVLRGPVTREYHPHAVDHMRGIGRREPHVPLQAIEQCSVRQIRGANKRGGQTGAALQQPRLRVQLRRPRIKRDPNLGADLKSSSTARFSVAPR